MDMEVNRCQAFFQSTDPQQKVKELQKVGNEEAVRWEALSASQHSPGPVAAGEVVCRQVTHPTFFDSETGKLKPTAFDDVSNKGLSVDRLSVATEKEIVERGEARNAEWNAKFSDKPSRTLHSLGHIHVNELRALFVGNERAFGIYDTALETNRSHADVCQLASGGPQQARSIRASLFEMTRCVPVDAQA
ncbi:hypothetical protein CIC12_03865 [Burkholderia sp. SG-MS1]|uniref:hypothetical protein n=1 Tax=Paraburkholderia sp. SG-MS1 TaxID=2023741 RepID=UPI001444CEC9|nr:hypothetical protein [Paraburkholderia sp. SG-MS1]NKJ45891.1 hypothetical protein [Paraburkholderia sp. SG-MS1]